MRPRLTALLVTLALLAGSFALFQFTEIDLWLQDRLFDFEKSQWLINKNAPVPRLLFYTGPKVIIIAIGAGLLLAVLVPARWRPAWSNLAWPTRRVAGFLTCLALVPALIGVLKSRSDIYCPWALERYGGNMPYHHFFDPLPAPGEPDRGRCFPAGHASGGFALMASALLFASRRARWIGLATGLAVGWMMGIYQMLKGAHFLSHTVTTMLIAALIIQIVALVVAPTRRLESG